MENKLSFEQIKQACIEEYAQYLRGVDSKALSASKEEFEGVENISELINTIDGLGFNGDEAYDFLISSILKQG